MDNKEFNLDKRRIDFVSFYHNIIDRFEMNVKDGRITFHRIIPRTTYNVWMNKDKITQVLDNFIYKAVKYSPDCGKIICKFDVKIGHIIINFTVGVRGID